MDLDERKKTRIIVVDLDGTLVDTDMLVENVFLFLRRYPLRILVLIAWLFKGKVYFKRRLADTIMPDVVCLPYNQIILNWLKQQRADGAKLILATASDFRIANNVYKYVGIFDEVIGTKESNISSSNKRAKLVQLYGERGYEYLGNSMADLAVWETASAIHIANPERGVLVAARKIGKVEMVFEDKPSYFPTLIKAMRIHQWAKNLLLFVPLLASHRIMEIPLLCRGLLGFIAFGACASSVYLLNDLLDLQDDRRHPSKYKRPLAAGNIPIFHALVLIPILLICALVVAFWVLPIRFAGVLAAYYLLTLAYSLWLKRVVMLDVVTLSLLYAIRVVAGAMAVELLPTFWMLTFCMFIFLSLAFVKRYTELRVALSNGTNEKIAGRGYLPEDFELLASLGGASGYISVLVLALYVNDATTGSLYRSPMWLWASCPLVLFWISRVWLLAHRGDMHEDPIVFALRDNVSLWVGIVCVVLFVLGTF